MKMIKSLSEMPVKLEKYIVDCFIIPTNTINYIFSQVFVSMNEFLLGVIIRKILKKDYSKVVLLNMNFTIQEDDFF